MGDTDEAREFRLRMTAEPMATVIDALNTMAMAVMNRTGRKGIKRLVIDREWALQIGMLPGESIEVATSCGTVTISVEMTAEDVQRRIHPDRGGS